MSGVPELTPTEFAKRWPAPMADAGVVLLDVREPVELEMARVRELECIGYFEVYVADLVLREARPGRSHEFTDDVDAHDVLRELGEACGQKSRAGANDEHFVDRFRLKGL